MFLQSQLLISQLGRPTSVHFYWRSGNLRGVSINSAKSNPPFELSGDVTTRRKTSSSFRCDAWKRIRDAWRRRPRFSRNSCIFQLRFHSLYGCRAYSEHGRGPQPSGKQNAEVDHRPALSLLHRSCGWVPPRQTWWSGPQIRLSSRPLFKSSSRQSTEYIDSSASQFISQYSFARQHSPRPEPDVSTTG